jgi:hypothetical protein
MSDMWELIVIQIMYDNYKAKEKTYAIKHMKVFNIEKFHICIYTQGTEVAWSV